jgi:hypothetical protein
VTLVVSQPAKEIFRGEQKRTRVLFLLAFFFFIWYNIFMDKNVYDIDDHSLTYGRGYVYSLQFVGRTPVESFLLRRDGE